MDEDTDYSKLIAMRDMTHGVQIKWKYRSDGWQTIACFDVREAADDYIKNVTTFTDRSYRVVTLA